MTRAWVNDSILKHSPNLSLNLLFLKIWISIGTNIHRFRIRKQMNGMVGINIHRFKIRKQMNGIVGGL